VKLELLMLQPERSQLLKLDPLRFALLRLAPVKIDPSKQKPMSSMLLRLTPERSHFDASPVEAASVSTSRFESFSMSLSY
jgi:hypothetical protein